MRRCRITPRPNWQQIVESQGLLFHSIDDRTYWDESAYYAFTTGEITAIEKATYALNEMCLKAVQHVIDEDRFDEFLIPESHRNWVRQSWERDELTLYGRFDLAYDARSPPKMLEYNADTPTSLLEAAVIQWFWLQDQFPQRDQFNSIHDRLIEAWQRIGPTTHGRVHFAGVGTSQEDFMTVAYLRDTAQQAKLQTIYLDMPQVGWDRRRGQFVDEQKRPIHTCFKLYPWEWMTRESFGLNLLTADTRWFEPPWKMLLSNKSLLVVLWELFPHSPFLLPADYEPLEENYVQKPVHSREGANVEIVVDGETLQRTEGPYTGPVVYQGYAPLPEFDGQHAVLGSWMVDGYACGMGIREDASLVTGNTSRFVPHVIEI
ncbi:MAG TPA: glutathionylspermidine synthase family protein [Tepidisphaeraceae bacterium]|jgi:glutathionylspermidine synthase